jgi:hypothetical protein
MNLCFKDFYLFFLNLIIFYLLYCNLFKKEGFQSTTDIKAAINTVYNADIEAIRNLSSIATQLTTNNSLTVPGNLQVTSKLSTNNLDPNNMPDGWTGGLRFFDGYSSATLGFGPDGKKLNALINKDGWAMFNSDVNIGRNLILSGDNSWIFHHPDDGRKTLYIAPKNNYWDWNNQIALNNDGSINCNKIITNNDSVIKGNLQVNGNLSFGGRSNIVSIFAGIVNVSCGSETTVTHNRNYPNPSKLSILLTSTNVQNCTDAKDMDVPNIIWNSINANSFKIWNDRLNNGCGACRSFNVHYTIFEFS